MNKIILFFCCMLPLVTVSAQSYNLIPQPVEVIPASGVFQLTVSTSIGASKEELSTARYLQTRLTRSTGFRLRIASAGASASILLKLNSALDLPAEGYTLSVTDKLIRIEGKDIHGLFYGVQTLLQLFSPQVYASKQQEHLAWTVPAVIIKDYPRFHYRGMMLDVSRQFFDLDTVKQYIDWLSLHKLNTFHWHLSDDQGWRVEIKKYPKLTSVGAWRGPNESLPPAYGSGDKRYGGFYTQKQIKEVIRYAAERHVEIIPEIDLPGHSRAAAGAYPEILCPTSRLPYEERVSGDEGDVWCVGNEANFKMLSEILKELAGLFPSRFIHIGGDEVNMSIWPRCPLCSALMKQQHLKRSEELQTYFVHRLSDIIHHLGKQMAGWDEILDGGPLEGNPQVYAWRSLKSAQGSVSKGVPTVIMVGQHFYFDMAQSKYERGHNWAGMVPLEKVYALDPADKSIFKGDQPKLIQGVQAAVWSELLNEPPRFLEYQSYPRICALAEIGWSQQSRRHWGDFYDRLTATHFDRLSNMGIDFRVPPPVVTYKDGVVTANAPYPGADLRYTLDGTTPSAGSTRYSAPLNTTDYQNFSFCTIYKGRSSASVPVEAVSPGRWTVDTAAVSLPQEWPLKGIVDRSGVWYASFLAPLVATTAAKVSQVRLCEDGIPVAFVEHASSTDFTLRYRLPLFAYDPTKKYSLKALVQGKDTLSGQVYLEHSVYKEPPVGITTNLNFKNNNPSLLTGYDFDLYVSTSDQGKAGQYLGFVFDTPVACSSIKTITGYSFTRISPLKSGHLEYTYDGKIWLQGDKFVKGEAQIHPEKPVKALRIMVDGPNDDPTILFQPLRIQ